MVMEPHDDRPFSKLLNKNMSTTLSKVFQHILIHVIVEKEFKYIFNLKNRNRWEIILINFRAL